MYIPTTVIVIIILFGWTTFKYFRDIAKDKEEELRQEKNDKKGYQDNSWMYESSSDTGKKKITPEDKDYFQNDWKA